jgi:hypothetical protein
MKLQTAVLGLDCTPQSFDLTFPLPGTVKQLDHGGLAQAPLTMTARAAAGTPSSPSTPATARAASTSS